jgi:hypothetical protein
VNFFTCSFIHSERLTASNSSLSGHPRNDFRTAIFEGVQEGLNEYAATYDDTENEPEQEASVVEMPFPN